MPLTITSVTPNVGATGGWMQVDVRGTGFRLPPPPPASNGPLPPPKPTMRVWFGAVEALNVRVISSTRLLVTTPVHDAGAVTLRAANVDDFGAELESATLAAAFTFTLPKFLGAAGKGTLVRVIRALIVELKRQVCTEVVLSRAVDWTGDPSDILANETIAKTPCVNLTGPTLRQNPNHQPGGTVRVPGGAGIIETRRPRMVDLVFGYGVTADSYTAALDMIEAATSFAVRNSVVTVPRDPDDASAGVVSFQLMLEQDLDTTSTPNMDEVTSAFGRIAILGVPLLGMPGIAGDLVFDQHPEVTDIVVDAGGITFVGI